MPQIKYTKTELRSQQVKLTQLEKYLPTLQLKKAMLQLEINQVAQALEELDRRMETQEERVSSYQGLLTTTDARNLLAAAKIEMVQKHYENIAGVEIPVFEKIVFEDPGYALFDTPYWLESGIAGVQTMIEIRERQEVFREKKKLLEKELRDVSIRVNLFEKIMIPRTKENIKKIKIFLGDQQLAAVSQAKVSKRKILERKASA